MIAMIIFWVYSSLGWSQCIQCAVMVWTSLVGCGQLWLHPCAICLRNWLRLGFWLFVCYNWGTCQNAFGCVFLIHSPHPISSCPCNWLWFAFWLCACYSLGACCNSFVSACIIVRAYFAPFASHLPKWSSLHLSVLATTVLWITHLLHLYRRFSHCGLLKLEWSQSFFTNVMFKCYPFLITWPQDVFGHFCVCMLNFQY
jgi:hypothetical protein